MPEREKVITYAKERANYNFTDVCRIDVTKPSSAQHHAILSGMRWKNYTKQFHFRENKLTLLLT